MGEAPEHSRQLALTINGGARNVPDPCTLLELLNLLELDRRRVAIAVNRDVVPRSVFPEKHLVAGDRVEILEAVGGGC
ncbi:MAG: sulfur carrier protein ThiS [Myxococcota bacterium]